MRAPERISRRAGETGPQGRRPPSRGTTRGSRAIAHRTGASRDSSRGAEILRCLGSAVAEIQWWRGLRVAERYAEDELEEPEEPDEPLDRESVR